MISNGLISEKLPLYLDSQSDIVPVVLDLLSMVDFSKQSHTNYFVDGDSLYTQHINGVDFATWLYDYSTSELRDIKKEVSIFIERSEKLYQNNDVISSLKDQTNFIIGKSSDSYIWNISDFLLYKQNRLKMISAKYTFAIELQECFLNIYFDNEVSGSLNTINNDFIDIRDEIVLHLQMLDKFHTQFQSMLLEGNNFNSLSLGFKEFSGIDCSPQSCRDSVIKLRRTFHNNNTKSDETITCELHTKFSTCNRDATKQDRIYFHPGKLGIYNGKIIVIHIGKHL